MKKFIFIFIFATFFYGIWAQSHTSTQSHQQSVTNICSIPSQKAFDFSFFSAGDDGFLIRWDDNNEGEHYQLSDVGIKLIAVSPNGNDVAVYESDGGSINKVSVWDWRNLSRKYQKKYTDSITSLNFSARGNYLIVGTATVDGAEFINTKSWTKTPKIKSNTSIINYIFTSDTEKTGVFYSPAGKLSYYNLQNGQLKEKFNVVQGLSQNVLFNDNKFLAGVKDNNIYVIHAYKGTTVASIKAQNPIILSSGKDKNLYYLEYDGRNNYELKMLESQDNQTISNPRLVKPFKGPRGENAICTGIKLNTEIILGSKSGEIYKSDIDPTITTSNFTQVTENTYSKILDMCPADSDFYFLTDKAIFKSSYDNGVVNKIYNENTHSNLINFDAENVILWSKATKKPVEMLNLTTKQKRTLFTPKNNVQSLKLSAVGTKQYLIEIESNTLINLYDITNREYKEIYSGTGVQDAIFADDGNLYIAKSASSNPKSPLISVNPETYETVPLQVNGNVAFGLSTDGKLIWGVNLQSDEKGKSTYIFSYNTITKKYTNILRFAEEDAEAFTYLYGNNLFTNIGKNKVYCYNITTKKRFSYNRSASIPVNICQNQSRVVILNSNGSISWCGTSNSVLLADWYLTTDEQWYEF